MTSFIRIVIFYFLSLFVILDGFLAIGITLVFELLYRLIYYSNRIFVFREWVLLLYSLNYIISPMITYRLDDSMVKYGMKIPSDQYFTLAIPGMFAFIFGLYILPTKIFKPNFKSVKDSAVVNEGLLVKTTFVTVFFKFIYTLNIGELSFIIYLASLLRFVSAFALFSIDAKKYFLLIGFVFSLDLITSLLAGMYHDVVMWLIFFAFYFVYTIRPSIRIKLYGAFAFLVFILFLQAVKGIYRQEVWFGEKEASLSTVSELGSQVADNETLLGEDNLLATLSRSNQAWIFASTVNNMDQNKNFQGTAVISKYLEAAMLPRFLAPNKIKSGDKEIFNEFSGHIINEGTSMGLGIFADGYIAYGAWGVYIFGFALGLIFSLTFKLVERWTKVSPFYVLLLLPLLNYAVRPDCELQTTINHLFKGILLYGFLVYLTRKRFTLDSQENQRKLMHLNLATSKK